MRRITLLLAVLTLGLVAACGGGDDGGSTGGPDKSGVSGGAAARGSGSDSAFCSPASVDAVFDSLDFTTGLDDLEPQFRRLGDALDEWADRAPREIEDEIDVLVGALRGLIELLEEYDFNFLAIGASAENDPRFAALDSDEFQKASDRISEYCGYDIDSSSPDSALPSGGGGGAGGGFTAAALPDDFPEELVPPDSEIGFVGRFGPGLTVEFTSTATIEEIVAFYREAIGEPSLVDDESSFWSVFEADSVITVAVTGTDGDLEVVVVVAGS